MKTFLKFGLVGVSNTLITILTYMLLVALGVNYILANILAYSLGVLNSYFWNKKWVFTVTSNQSFTFLKFIFVNLITLALNTVCLFILVDYIEIHPFISQIVSTGLGMVVNFLANKKWTFK